MNDKLFWNTYLKYMIIKLENLLSQHRKHYLVDLHIHTAASSDGSDTFLQKIKRAKEEKFDIISITDHDTFAAYDELYDLIIRHEICIDDVPIIIPGIEFSVYYEKYNGLCHVLEYSCNPKSLESIEKEKVNIDAYWKRCKIQFERLNYNPALNYYRLKYDIHFSEEEYFNYLKREGELYPEYKSLIDYIYLKLKEKNITISDVKEKLSELLIYDQCNERKEKMKFKLEEYQSRHRNEDINLCSRLLMPLLAPVGIDDADYPNEEQRGSLSVGKYGQLNIREMVGEGIYILAHPDVERLGLLLNDIPFLGTGIWGYEINANNWKSTGKEIEFCADKNGFVISLGSDSHSVKDSLYINKQCFLYKWEYLQKLYLKAKVLV